MFSDGLEIPEYVADVVTIVQLLLGVLLPIAMIGWVDIILDSYFGPEDLRFYPEVALALIGGIVVIYLLGTLYE
ncbi:hypothetical protein [Natrinema hispanicum]|uniref:Uncharacterized protein n=1 Tax=Natrinema hispanicum TaxID=392421 RepID=A0A1G6SHC2_9EURY|nr:hypothetical protein [Natrinema hispanicum]SDD16054.1 hypothetical protein SAMN05192552_101422 [Natrinema hispanicum]SET27156.1 hypothetical protein SAMN04488694_10522 [Natrinema hispanicum]